ncbi:sulfotransferase family protein [Thalassospira sp. MA62]|nr:sulfotransferase family protein [Thalassospira sp. MA62]
MMFSSRFKSRKSPLLGDEDFNFRLNHALCLYKSNSIYTFIPKNACSSIRFSLAIDNGFLQEDDEPDWIHQNNELFSAKISDAVRCSYAFVILRCPFRRIASVFLDKVVSGDAIARSILKIRRTRSERVLGKQDEFINRVTFKDFLYDLSSLDRTKMNHHWRPQVDFLLYENYSKYFCVEMLQDASNVLREDLGFSIYDTRNKLGHDTSRYKKTILDCKDLKVIDFRSMKENGEVPDYRSMYCDQTIDMVKRIYEDDVKLYSEKIGKHLLLFS